MKITQNLLLPALFSQSVKLLNLFSAFKINCEKVDLANKLCINGFSESNFIYAPVSTIGQNNPLYPFISGIVYSLLYKLVFELKTNCFDFKKKLNFAVQLCRKVAEGSSDCVF